MSGFKEHAIGGAIGSIPVLAGTYFYSRDIGLSALFAVSVFVGSLVPDIDTGSVPSRWFARIGIVASAFLMYSGLDKYAAIIGLIYMGLSAGKHRGLTHSWMFIIVCLGVGTAAIFGKLPIYLIFLAPFSFGLFIHSVIIDRK